MADTRRKFFQETQRINAHAQKVRRIIIDANAGRTTLVEQRAISFRRATQRAGAGPAFNDQLTARRV